MIKKIVLVLLSALIVFACENKTEVDLKEDLVDLEAVKSELNTIAESFYKGMTESDTDLIDSMLFENGLYLGTDPDEIWIKDTITTMFEEIKKDTAFEFTFTVNLREIVVSPDGKSGIVIEHHANEFISTIMQTRFITHYIMTENGWKINLMDWSVIPENEYLPIVNKALKSDKEK